MNSTRFPGKALHPVKGFPMLDWVVRCSCTPDGEVFVVSDDEAILDWCWENRVKSLEASGSCGTHRCINAIQEHEDRIGWGAGDILVNVQGDTIPTPGIITKVAQEASLGGVATVAYTPPPEVDPWSPHRVKVVLDGQKALYFSRSMIPFRASRAELLVHAGIYAFSHSVVTDMLERGYPHQTNLGKLEGLEQLDWPYDIYVLAQKDPIPSLDTPEDIKMIERYLDKW